MGRFPFGIPNSWYQVCYSDELARGEVKTVHYLDRDIVLFRGHNGQAGALEPYCPHLGAHFGHGGKVEGDNLACPFHSWQFNGAGTCVHIPYTDKIPSKAKAGAYPVLERNGIIFVWYHDQGLEPHFEIPTIPYWGDPAWTSSYEKYSWIVKTHPQEIMENAIDWPHFNFVHLMDPPKDRSNSFHGPMFKWQIGTKKEVQTMGVTDSFTIEAENWGLGFDWLKYTGMFTTMIVAGLTPIDTETTQIHFGVIGAKDGRSEEETRALLKAYMDDQSLAIQQDFQIWEHKGFQVRPSLCEADGPIGEYRKWTKQFYSRDWSEAVAAA
ncbi:MAG TPA: Rieske 2Fe-2S domain-containing protein [Candidatus Limnocylindrales bacterium]|nr:Rieske 2Fe-2S domain-containing protein [Candidatus Limnocylindrales bacterium]